MKKWSSEIGRKNRWQVAVALMFGATSAMAQTQAESAPEDDGNVELQEVVITASRVQRADFEAPTPTTVIDEETIARMGRTNIGDTLAQMPSFQSDQNASTGTLGGNAGRRYANLRNLGSQRTLVMMDSIRLLPSATTGQVDLNSIPQILIERADVVTGGASAQWGSDAVSGVVNLITRRNFEGFEFDASYGESDAGDNEERHLGALWGSSFSDGRGSVLFGTEWVDNKGTGTMYSRDWGREEWGFVPNADYGSNGLARTLVLPNVHRNVLVAPGIITSGPFAGTTFDENGQAVPFEYGEINGAGTMSGGQGYGTGNGAGVLLSVPVERSISQLRVSYDLTPTTEIYGIANFGYIHLNTRGASHGDNTAVTILSGNPFIPAPLQAQMDELGVDSFGVSRFWRDDPRGNGLGSSVDINTYTRNQYYTLGANGVLAGDWRWDGYMQYAESEVQFQGDGIRINANYANALDAVRDENGTIVCRSTLTNPGDGCVPINLLGPDTITLDAWNYITGNQRYVTTYDRRSAAFNLNGTPFQTWAGDVSVATGLEYRKDKTELVQHDETALSNGYVFFNTKPIAGSIEVKEAYLESVIPLAANLRGMQGLDFTGAVRLTDYSTSGDVTTWKAGVNYTVNDAVRFRASLSRDIRAPNVSELFTSTSTGTTNIVNPETGGNLTVRTTTSGNIDLDPERSKTRTAGVVLTPDVPGDLRFSADYYDIDIRDVIASVSAQQIFNYCYEGAQEYCDLITPISQQEAAVRVLQMNLAQLRVKGWDFASSYGFYLPSVPGRFSLNYYLTYQPTVIVDNGTSRVDRAGDMGTAASPYGGPKTKWNALLTYGINNLSTTVGVRYVGAGKKNVTYTEDDISDNSVKSATYVMLSAAYDVPLQDGKNLQFYGSVQNLLDKDPPVDPTSAEGAPYNATFHDVIGRSYMAGIRLRF